MNCRRDRFVMGLESECLTAVPDNPTATDSAVAGLLGEIARMIPTLPAPAGIFCPYGRVYVDMGHVELALCECDSPYQLAIVHEQLQTVIAQAVRCLEARGVRLVLANNNYSGLLKSDCPVWGSHENYLSEVHPTELTPLILPFLVSRIYAGSGAIFFPSGDFLAGARPTCIRVVTGGSTTESRAIHSTAREEHHMGRRPRQFRLHGILADGHRSHFNLALQFGATALAVKAMIYDQQLSRDLLRVLSSLPTSDWLALLNRFNRLAGAADPLRIDPLVPRIQRVYLAAARRYAATLTTPPDWIARTLQDWEDTLTAFERHDRRWLACRLDAFVKFELFSAVLQQMGADWTRLPSRQDCFHELALLDQSYHEFCHPQSLFASLERAGILQHRVGPRLAPGSEAEPYVPATATRAQARARYIVENQGQTSQVLDWSTVEDRRTSQRRYLNHPFARRYSRWKGYASTRGYEELLEGRGVVEAVEAGIRRGEYERTRGQLRSVEQMMLSYGAAPPEIVRRMALLEARRGEISAVRHLEAVVPAGWSTPLAGIVDYCAAYRYLDWPPNLRRLEPWIARGQAALEHDRSQAETEEAWTFREHVAFAYLKNQRWDEAGEWLQDAESRTRHLPSAIRGRVLATWGELHRVRDDVTQARELLERARAIQESSQCLGDLADYTYAFLAKTERDLAPALRWLQTALALQHAAENVPGMVTSLALQARLEGPRPDSDQRRNQIVALASTEPVLRRSPILERIFAEWLEWTSGRRVGPDAFWGL